MSVGGNSVRSLPVAFRKSTQLYYVVAAIYAFSVALPHAVLTPILLDKGLSYADIAFIQIGFSHAVFLFEVPSGMLSDVFSRKRVYLASKLLIGTFFVLVYFSEGTGWLFFAWAVYGVSAALDSGTIGNDVILNIRDHLASAPDKRASFVEYIVRMDVRVEAFFMVLGGTIGSVIFAVAGLQLYWVAVAGALLCFLLVFIFFPEGKSDVVPVGLSNFNGEILRILRIGLKQLKQDRDVRIFMLGLAIVQIFFQTHFQLWQALVLELGFERDSLAVF